MTTKIITLGNTKGGTGKTTSTLNLASELGSLGKKVLIVDLDPQSSLSKVILGEENLKNYRGIEELLSNPKQDATQFIAPSKIKNVSIIPSHSSLSETALKLVMSAGFFALKDVLRKIQGFDYILLDIQPSKNILMLNAFTTSDYVIIPTNLSIYPLLDILELEEIIRDTMNNSNPNLSILGVIVAMKQKATVYNQLEEDLRRHFGEKVFKNTISRAVKSEESALEGVGVSELDPKCKLSSEYKALTNEILERLQGGN